MKEKLEAFKKMEDERKASVIENEKGMIKAITSAQRDEFQKYEDKIQALTKDIANEYLSLAPKKT